MFVCLNDNHPCNYLIVCDPEKECQYCNTKDSSCIKYSYLPLADKVIHWCSTKDFCRKKTIHWTEKDQWLNAEKGSAVKRETQDYRMVIDFVNYPGFGIQQRSEFYQPVVQCAVQY